ncbi:S41 family peptidase [Brevundimonas sp.]|uniref:S41 family peptidase n=1 Tax=Brevundimonas sp. TaxID=1871086 RepID=UPI003D12BA4A
MRHATALAFAISLLFGGLASASEPLDPRRVVDEVANAIEANYFDVAGARTAASALRTEAEDGAYDRYLDSEQLAVALTRRLKPIDGHFGVAGPPSAPAPEEEAGLHIDYEDQVRRINYGFRSLEILPGNIGYIDLRFFADIDFDAAKSPEKMAADAALQTLAHTDAVVIDLRDNGGGSPAMAMYLASAFLPPESNAYMFERDRTGTETSLRPAEPYAQPRVDVPLIILISARSASAAEAFPYMLQSAGRATIVGQPSMGAASMAQPIATPSGFSVFVPFAVTLSPLTQTNWERSGVQPDIVGPVEDARNHGWALALQKVVDRGAPEAIAVEDRWIIETLGAPDYKAPLDHYAGQYGDVRVFVENERLLYRQGQRPPWTLRALSVDLFTVEGEPTQRVRFNRDGQGRISGLNVLWSEGSTSPAALRQD